MEATLQALTLGGARQWLQAPEEPAPLVEPLGSPGDEEEREEELKRPGSESR